jgi:hypothetical protein
MAGVEGGMWAAAPLGEHILAVQPILSARPALGKDPTGVGRLFPAKQRTNVERARVAAENGAARPPADPEQAMRLIDVILISAVIGMILGLVQTGLPGARASGGLQVAASDCAQSMCERITWLRAPLLRRATSAE